MIEEYDMDVICFCELGPISGHMENTLRKWMHLPGGVAKSIGMKTASPLMEQMLRDLVDNSSDWKAYATAHYGLLINSKTVDLIQEPVLVGVYAEHPDRVAMKFQIASFVVSVENLTQQKSGISIRQHRRNTMAI